MKDDNLEAREPHWLVIMFCGEETAVEEDQEKDCPIHCLRLDCFEAPLLCHLVCFQEPFSPSNFYPYLLILLYFPTFMRIPHKVAAFYLF